MFGDGSTRNVFFDVDNSSSSHVDNCKNNFLVLGEGPTDDINGTIGTAEKKIGINFIKKKEKILLYNDDNSYLFVNRKKVYVF